MVYYYGSFIIYRGNLVKTIAIIRLLPLFLLSSYHVNAEVPLSEFFSFGNQAGDSELPPNDDSFADVQIIGLDFTFFLGKTQEALCVYFYFD
jgi:hypothetical protein